MLIEHTLSCPPESIGEVLENLREHNANGLRAELRGDRYIITYKTEWEEDANT